MFDLEGELFFGSAPDLERRLGEIERAVDEDTRVVILCLQRARNADATFLNTLGKFHRRLRERGAVLLLCGVRPDLAAALRDTGLDAVIGGGGSCGRRPSRTAARRRGRAAAWRLLAKMGWAEKLPGEGEP